MTGTPSAQPSSPSWCVVEVVVTLEVEVMVVVVVTVVVTVVTVDVVAAVVVGGGFVVGGCVRTMSSSGAVVFDVVVLDVVVFDVVVLVVVVRDVVLVVVTVVGRRSHKFGPDVAWLLPVAMLACAFWK